ncbi:MAG: cell division protein FtsZ [Chlorobi bacterium]|nr:cell division protein FtsZ [Chlorobiota bacterium]
MKDDLISFDLPKSKSSIIKVIGVGGGGGNAVNHMFRQGITNVDFVLCNTDAQALQNSSVPVKIQLGESLTEGRGAGNKPEIGREAAIESLNTVSELLQHNTNMVFITAGMGGGTGTGAAPIIAEEAKKMGILTVAILTMPFKFEGRRRMEQAIEGIKEIKKSVDSLLVIHNERLREMYGDLKVSDAFARADNVLTIAAKGIAEIITVHGSVNVDFADVETVMSNSGVAIMGSGIAEGENRAITAIQDALSSPLLNNNDIHGASNILLNLTSGKDEIRMDEVGQITDYVQEASGQKANIIWGIGIDESLEEKINITIIATGFNVNSIPEIAVAEKMEKDIVRLPDSFSDDIITPKPPITEVTSPEIDIFASQRTIEFEGTNNTPELFELEEEETTSPAEKSEVVNGNKKTEKIPNRNKKLEELKRISYKTRKSKNINELEQEPAYLRKKINLEESELSSKENNELSKFTLSEDEEKKIRISEENKYLHDNVD